MSSRYHTITRRRALLATAAAVELRAASEGPFVATAGYLWQRRLQQQKRPLAEGLDEIFRASAAAGFRRMELTSDFLKPDLLDRVAALIERYRLEVPVFYYWAVLHEAAAAETSLAGLEAVAGGAQSLGASILDLSIAWKPGKRPKTDEELAVETGNVRRIAERMAVRGFKTALHNHDVEMLDGAREWRYLMRNLESVEAGACLDIDWVYRAGQDPGVIIGELPGRIHLVHLRNASGGQWTQELGEGDYDWGAVASHLKKAGFRGYLVAELIHEPGMTTVTRSVEENLRRSRELMEKTFGGA
jgi:inosose dehydratase